MTIPNVTGNANLKTYRQSVCSAETTGGTQNYLIFLSVLNILLSIVAFLGNSLILVALHKDSSLHPPSKLLFRNLAATDLCVGIIVEPLAVINWISVVSEQWSVCRYSSAVLFLTAYVLCSVSFLTLTAISVDRLLALLLGLRYRQVVTLKRTYALLVVVWVVSIFGTGLSFWNTVILSLCSYIITSICAVISMCSYTKIFLTLRHHHHQVENIAQVQPSRTIPLNIARYRKTVFIVLWVQLTLVVCYLPYNLLAASTNHITQSTAIFLARQVTGVLIYLNSSLNPILYCWKIREVRQAVKETITQFICL